MLRSGSRHRHCDSSFLIALNRSDNVCFFIPHKLTSGLPTMTENYYSEVKVALLPFEVARVEVRYYLGHRHPTSANDVEPDWTSRNVEKGEKRLLLDHSINYFHFFQNQR